jgi:uncharacterized membrane protein YeaQ/YmgE (transglycosylase-associated protein family)
MGILAWIIFGALAGWIASMLAGTDGSQGWLGNIIIGILGAIIGGFLGSMLLGVGVSGFNISSMLVAIGGALLLLFITGMARRRV